ASAQAELASENLAAFAEVAKKVQTETVDLMLSTGKELGEEAEAAVKKATDEVSKVAKKATAAAKAAK
ncbi:MAG TPA: phasin, PhaP, partial [Aliiroseovarius sp.]|nr:phasin, PhaP [Aliiroseovarius sp.]